MTEPFEFEVETEIIPQGLLSHTDEIETKSDGKHVRAKPCNSVHLPLKLRQIKSTSSSNWIISVVCDYSSLCLHGDHKIRCEVQFQFQLCATTSLHATEISKICL